MSDLKTLPDTDWEKTLRISVPPREWQLLDDLIELVNECQRVNGYRVVYDRVELVRELITFLVIAIERPASPQRRFASIALFTDTLWERLKELDT